MASSSAKSNGSTGTKEKPKKKAVAKKTAAKKKAPAKKLALESRAVLRLIEAGSTAECPHCEERVKFRARHRDQQTICNIYVDGVWNRVEQYHEQCYKDAGKPYGRVIRTKSPSQKRAAANKRAAAKTAAEAKKKAK